MLRRWRLTGIVYLFLALIFLSGAIALSQAAKLNVASTVVAILPTIPPLFLAWRVFREDRADLEQAVTADDLCEQVSVAVRKQWESEISLRSIDDPYPLPLSLRPGESDLFDEPLSASVFAPHGDTVGTLMAALTGRCLVVLGNPGSGKTVLLIQFVLRMLDDRQPSKPVPLLLPLASWDPRNVDFAEWVKQRLEIEHPSLRLEAPPSMGSKMPRSQALLERGLIFPVLDGLDELPRAVRSLALQQINDSVGHGRKLVISSRIEEFREAVRPPGVRPLKIRRACGIEVTALRPDVVAEYWRRDAGDGYTANRWNDVVRALEYAGPLATVFRTPLMVSLARAIYNPRAGESVRRLPDPRELCDRTYFSSARMIQRHLFDGFVQAAYRDAPRAKRRPGEKWGADDAIRWLRYLALHLETHGRGTPDFRWWAVPSAVHRVTLVTTTCIVSLLLLVAALTPAWLVGEARAGGSLLPLLIIALSLCFCAGLAVLIKSSSGPAQGLRWSQEKGRRAVLFGLIFALQGSVSAGLIMYVLSNSLAGGVIFGFLGLLSGAFITLLLGLETTPADLGSISNPAESLLRDRSAFRVLCLIFGINFALVASISVGLVMGAVEQPRRLVYAGRPDLILLEDVAPAIDAGVGLYWAYVGAVAGLALGAILGLARSTWASYFMARSYLAVRRRLPWRLMGFLRDAHLTRGILRQAGPVYQFRHIELQRRLAELAAAESTLR